MKETQFATNPGRVIEAGKAAAISLGYRIESAGDDMLKFQSARSWRVSHGLDVTATFLPADDGTRVTLVARIAKPGAPFGSGRSTAGALGEEGAVASRWIEATSSTLG